MTGARPREVNGYLEGWGLRSGSRLLVYGNRIDGTRYQRVRVHPYAGETEQYALTPSFEAGSASYARLTHNTFYGSITESLQSAQETSHGAGRDYLTGNTFDAWQTPPAWAMPLGPARDPIDGAAMSAVNCSACGKPFTEGTIDTTGVGIVCDACLSSGSVDDPLALPKRAAIGAVGVLFASQCVSFRTTSSTESTVNGHGERTVTSSMDVPQLGALGVVVAVILFGAATVVRPLQNAELRTRAGQLALSFVVLTLFTLWRVSVALPSTVTVQF